MEKTEDEIEKEIIDYLKEHKPQYKTCVLATSKDNIPRATPLMLPKRRFYIEVYVL